LFLDTYCYYVGAEWTILCAVWDETIRVLPQEDIASYLLQYIADLAHWGLGSKFSEQGCCNQLYIPHCST